ncbi:hypothetical protein F5Y16DRAFT_403529 [Xylariaceae sp. FL0255]|nr:hypothetical protein F5Y16DRAFT_403529 [Xylariaceae sp. FL0255]
MDIMEVAPQRASAAQPPSRLESIPNELKMHVVNHLVDDPAAIINLALVGPKFYSLVSDVESEIAAKIFVAGILPPFLPLADLAFRLKTTVRDELVREKCASLELSARILSAINDTIGKGGPPDLDWNTYRHIGTIKAAQGCLEVDQAVRHYAQLLSLRALRTIPPPHASGDDDDSDEESSGDEVEDTVDTTVSDDEASDKEVSETAVNYSISTSEMHRFLKAVYIIEVISKGFVADMPNPRSAPFDEDEHEHVHAIEGSDSGSDDNSDGDSDVAGDVDTPVRADADVDGDKDTDGHAHLSEDSDGDSDADSAVDAGAGAGLVEATSVLHSHAVVAADSSSDAHSNSDSPIGTGTGPGEAPDAVGAADASEAGNETGDDSEGEDGDNSDSSDEDAWLLYYRYFASWNALWEKFAPWEMQHARIVQNLLAKHIQEVIEKDFDRTPLTITESPCDCFKKEFVLFHGPAGLQALEQCTSSTLYARLEFVSDAASMKHIKWIRCEAHRMWGDVFWFTMDEDDKLSLSEVSRIFDEYGYDTSATQVWYHTLLLPHALDNNRITSAFGDQCDNCADRWAMMLWDEDRLKKILPAAVWPTKEELDVVASDLTMTDHDLIAHAWDRSGPGHSR